MYSMLPESDKLRQLLVSDEQMEVINSMVVEITKNRNYCTDPLWELDSKLGTITGAAKDSMDDFEDLDDSDRSIYTPLQYARDEIEICNVSYSARYVVLYSMMHLEEILKYVLKINSTLGRYRFNHVKLDRLILKISSLKLFSEDILESYNAFLPLYKRCRNEMHNTELFSAADALVVYISSRVLGTVSLEYIHSKEAVPCGEKPSESRFKFPVS